MPPSSSVLVDRRRLVGFVVVVVLLQAVMGSGARASSHLQEIDLDTSSNVAGETATYTLTFQIGDGNDPLASGEPTIRITFPEGYDLSGAAFDEDASGTGDGDLTAPDPFPAHDPAVVDEADRQVTISGIDKDTVPDETVFRVVVTGVTNPESSGSVTIGIEVLDADDETNSSGSAELTIANAGLASFSVTSPSLGSIGDQTVGEAFAVRIRALDAFGNRVDGTGGGETFTGTVTVSSNVAGSSGLGTSASFTDGELAGHAITLTEVAANATITATSGGASGTSNTFAVVEGDADRLVITRQPTTTLVDEVIDPAITIEVRDAFGNVITSDDGSTVTVALQTNPGDGELGGTTSRQTSNGVVTFDDLTISEGGTGYVLRFTYQGLDPVDSAAFDVLIPAQPPILSQATPNEQGFTFTVIDFDLDRYEYSFDATNDAILLVGADGAVHVMGLELGEQSTVTVTATARSGSGYVGSAESEVLGIAAVMLSDDGSETTGASSSDGEVASGNPDSLANTGAMLPSTVLAFGMLLVGALMVGTTSRRDALLLLPGASHVWTARAGPAVLRVWTAQGGFPVGR